MGYREEASSQLQGSYDAKRRQYENALNQGLTDLDNSKTGINQNFDHQVKNQALQNKLGKNNFANASLGRGMGRSSIAVSGLAGMDARNERITNDINTARTGELNNVENQKGNLRNNFNNSILGLESEKESAINDLARKLQERADDMAFRDKQLAQQKEIADSNRAIEWARLQYQKDKDSQSQEKAKKPNEGSLWATYYDYRDEDPQKAKDFVMQNRGSIISTFGVETYRAMADEDSKYQSSLQPQQQEEEDIGWLGSLKNFFFNRK